MSQKSHFNCPICARACDDAKEEAKRLNKKVFLLTITLTSALTLLGEKAAQEVLAYVKVVQDTTESSEGKSVDGSLPTDVSVKDGDHPEHRTSPLTHGQSMPMSVQPVDGMMDEHGSEIVGLSVPNRGWGGQLIDLVNGRMPSMGELLNAPMGVPVNDDSNSYTGSGLSIYHAYIPDVYMNNTMMDTNARFVTDSPFGGYPSDLGFAAIPTPATGVLIGITPIICYRSRRR